MLIIMITGDLLHHIPVHSCSVQQHLINDFLTLKPLPRLHMMHRTCVSVSLNLNSLVAIQQRFRHKTLLAFLQTLHLQ